MNEYIVQLTDEQIPLKLVINRDTGTISLVSSGLLLEIEVEHIKKVIDYNFN